MAITTTSVQHEDTNDVDIRINRRKSLIKEFSIVGRLNTMHAKINSNENIDIIDLMDNLKSTSIRLFKEIKDRLDYKTNAAELDKPKNKNAGKSRSGATKILKQHKAIKKTGQRSYIVNPYLIVPPAAYQEDILAKWNSPP